MGTGLFLLALAALLNGAAFFGLRYLAARVSGVRGAQAVLGADHREAWAGVSLARRALFAVAGPIGCYLCAASFITFGLTAAGSQVVDEESMRVVVVPGGPAASAGVQDNDRIVSVNDVPIRDWPQLRGEVAKSANSPARVVVKRHDGELTLTPTPGPTGKIGVAPPMSRRSIGVGPALASGIVGPVRVWGAAAKGLKRAATGEERAEVAGPVSLAKATGEASAEGLGSALGVVGAMNAYFLWIPAVLALVLFPRRRVVRPSPG
ncbi:MAG: PDZ domain-containing protein [Myxococcales bacterium]|nr:PDZ domain-containing protein [Myxococcales bacterium]